MAKSQSNDLEFGEIIQKIDWFIKYVLRTRGKNLKRNWNWTIKIYWKN